MVNIEINESYDGTWSAKMQEDKYLCRTTQNSNPSIVNYPFYFSNYNLLINALSELDYEDIKGI